METGDYVLFGILVLLVVAALILNPAIGFAILFFLYIHSKVKKQKAEQSKDMDLRKWRLEDRQDAYYDRVNKRIAKRESKQ